MSNRIFRSHRTLVARAIPSPQGHASSRPCCAVGTEYHLLSALFAPRPQPRRLISAAAELIAAAASSCPTAAARGVVSSSAIENFAQSQARPAVSSAGVLFRSISVRMASTDAAAKVEAAKDLAAKRAVAEHFSPSFKWVGIGSGTTILYVINEIKRVLGDDVTNTLFVPTGYQSRSAIVAAGLVPVAFDTLPDNVVLDVAFDGADEVDDELNCIKGGGACLFQEKLVAERARKFVCVADYRKLQPRLLANWPTIPIEVAPIATQAVLHALIKLGSTAPKVRAGLLAKTGPLKTDQDFFIIDAPFAQPLLTSSDVAAGKGKGDGSDGTWEVSALSSAIKAITGVLEVGLFCGVDGITAFAEKKGTACGGQKPVAVYFGMQDGSVEVRARKE
ncbi:ribose 5-phosphate isomerase A [Verruconis gallopava]|uniref:Ribose-5-phosphate isomerase n=1 Tax=Verruconis gallopava TaxID=253628 RepID=A0A0D2A4J0_9PEZI|nr:ribose 5-phosphate isomerase A [Verruconis gallopava]KIW01703.1 ribose 5-phosphate isomerase A [Verruconis gallopava]